MSQTATECACLELAAELETTRTQLEIERATTRVLMVALRAAVKGDQK
jgi:hypothetical protein